MRSGWGCLSTGIEPKVQRWIPLQHCAGCRCELGLIHFLCDLLGVEFVDLLHVAEQDVLTPAERRRDQRLQRRVVHLRAVSIQNRTQLLHVTTLTVYQLPHHVTTLGRQQISVSEL